MQTHICKLGELFDKPVQWVVPVYQRHYVWQATNDEQIPGMWDDWLSQTEKLLDGKTPSPHYFGAIIYSGNTSVSDKILKRDLVDGQQRLTTFQLAFAALRDTGKGLGYNNAGNINEYIFNIPNEKNNASQEDEDKYKLLPSKHDRKTFQKIVANNDENPAVTSQLVAAYNCFCDSIGNFINERIAGKDEDETQDLVEKLIEILKEALLDTFQVVIILLGDEDEAQQIFASLNGKGEPLSAFDLIRNDIFYRARGNNKHAEKLFEDKWFYFEDAFWTKKRGAGHTKKTRAEHFIVDAVIAQTAQEVKQRRIVAEYKKYINQGHFNSVSDELNSLIRYGVSYHGLEKPDGGNTDHIAKLLKLWDSSTINPLVMWIDTRENEKLSLDDKRTLFSMIESYIIRRHICKLRTNSLDKNVANILRGMHDQKDDMIGAFKQFLQNETADSKRMPTDGDILSACEQMPIYKNSTPSRLKYILEKIEKHIRTKNNENVTIDTNDLNIEHIMPQSWAENWTLKDGVVVPHENYWDAFDANPHLDSNVKELMEKRQSLIHTIGNLTLVTPAFNTILSNSAWGTKRGMIEEEAVLRLNRAIAKEPKWNEDTIKNRSAELAKRINKIWQSS